MNNLKQITTPISLQQLEREIAEQRSALYHSAPPNAAAVNAQRNAVTDLTARLSLAETDNAQAVIKSDLQAAQRRLAQLIDQREQHEQDTAKLKADEARLAELQNDDRRNKAAEADRRLAEAHSRFVHTAKEMCRAYRDACRIASMNQRIPGASIALPSSFTIDKMVPAGWQGKTSDHIHDDGLSWLRDENNQTYTQENAA